MHAFISTSILKFTEEGKMIEAFWLLLLTETIQEKNCLHGKVNSSLSRDQAFVLKKVLSSIQVFS